MIVFYAEDSFLSYILGKCIGKNIYRVSPESNSIQTVIETLNKVKRGEIKVKKVVIFIDDHYNKNFKRKLIEYLNRIKVNNNNINHKNIGSDIYYWNFILNDVYIEIILFNPKIEDILAKVEKIFLCKHFKGRTKEEVEKEFKKFCKKNKLNSKEIIRRFCKYIKDQFKLHSIDT